MSFSIFELSPITRGKNKGGIKFVMIADGFSSKEDANKWLSFYKIKEGKNFKIAEVHSLK